MLGLVEKVVIGCQHLAGFLGGREPSLDRPQPGTKHTALGLGSFQQKPTAAATAWHAVLGTGQWTSPWLFRRIPVCLPLCSPERGLPVLGPQPPALTSPSQILPLWTGRAVPKPRWLESPPKASGRGFLPALGLRGGGEAGRRRAGRPVCTPPSQETARLSLASAQYEAGQRAFGPCLCEALGKKRTWIPYQPHWKHGGRSEPQEGD